MPINKFISAEQTVALIKDGDTIGLVGSGGARCGATWPSEKMAKIQSSIPVIHAWLLSSPSWSAMSWDVTGAGRAVAWSGAPLIGPIACKDDPGIAIVVMPRQNG